MTTFVALGDSITLGIGDPVPGRRRPGLARLGRAARRGPARAASCTTWRPTAPGSPTWSATSCRGPCNCGRTSPAWSSGSTTRCGRTSTPPDRGRGRAHRRRAARGRRRGADDAAARPRADARPARRAGPAAGPADARDQRWRWTPSPSASARCTSMPPRTPRPTSPRMWAADRLHPSERGHRLIARRFHGLLAAAGLPGRAPARSRAGQPAAVPAGRAGLARHQGHGLGAAAVYRPDTQPARDGVPGMALRPGRLPRRPARSQPRRRLAPARRPGARLAALPGAGPAAPPGAGPRPACACRPRRPLPWRRARRPGGRGPSRGRVPAAARAYPLSELASRQAGRQGRSGAGQESSGAPATAGHGDGRDGHLRQDGRVTSDDLLGEAVSELYEADPEEFTRRRGELAAAARSAGQAGVARQIAGLRKPTRSAWMINRLVRADPDAVARLATVGEELRAAEHAGDGARLRESSQARRELIATLVPQALAAAGEHNPPAALREEITATFSAALADPVVAEQIQHATLLRPARRVGFGTAAAPELALVPPPPPDARPAARPARKRGGGRPGRGRHQARDRTGAPQGRSRGRTPPGRRSRTGAPPGRGRSRTGAPPGQGRGRTRPGRRRPGRAGCPPGRTAATGRPARLEQQLAEARRLLRDASAQARRAEATRQPGTAGSRPASATRPRDNRGSNAPK